MIDEVYNKGFERKPYVNVRGEWIGVDSVTFLDIEEDFEGRDVMTFEYQGQKYRSHIINRIP